MTGFINIDKDEGVTSAKVTSVVRHLTGMPCGHMGTLDPIASGVLPIGIGNACRLFDYILDKEKTYEAVFRFGVDTDTLDITGTILKSDGRVPSIDEIKDVLPSLIGEIDQVPPAYSAKNVNGTRSYVLARRGENVALSPKKVRIDSIDVNQLSDSDFSFVIVCGGGTYIRSIARDIATLLGTCAVMTDLVRTRSGFFELYGSVKLEALTRENVYDYVIRTEDVISYESVHFCGPEETKLKNGQEVSCYLADGFYKVFFGDEFYGIGAVGNQKIKLRTKLC